MANTNWLDDQHRAYEFYRAHTVQSATCERLNRQLLSGPAKDRSTVTFYDCQISRDWIDRIQQGLPFLENAIAEGRQFIIKQGKTVAIEKVKRVGKSSIEHLAKHSELITRVPEPGGDVVPDRLYVTENIGTFAVYENRFLYMLLCRLREFIDYRNQAIQKMISTFDTALTAEHEISENGRNIRFRLSFQESSVGLPGTVSPETEFSLQQIQTLLQQVEQLLKTELMREVSNAPMLHPPVSRTNVMLHNNNFREAFALYSFLEEYQQEGFHRVERCSYDDAPTDSMEQDLANLISITSYLTYRNGGLLEELQQRELSRQIEETQQRWQEQKERLQKLRQKLPGLDAECEAYLLELEKWNEELEQQSELLYAAEQKRAEAEQRLLDLNGTITPLKERVCTLEETLQDTVYRLDMQTKTAETAAEQSAQAQRQFAIEKENFAIQQAEMEAEFRRQYELLAEKYRLACGCQLASIAVNGIAEQFTSKEDFSRLESQYLAFKKFYERQWTLSKKQIRAEQLHPKQKGAEKK